MMTSFASSLARFRRLLPFVSPFVQRLTLVFGLSLFGTLLGLLWPIFTKILIDDVLLAKNLRLLFVPTFRTYVPIFTNIVATDVGNGAISSDWAVFGADRVARRLI